MRKTLLLGVAAALLLAGCTSQLPATPTPTLDPQLVQAANATVSLTACEEFHTFFTSPKDGFEQYVPTGFEFAPGDPTGTTAQVVVVASACPQATEMWAALLVIPPSSHANQTIAFDGIILQGLTDNQTHFAIYNAWGLGARLAQADTTSLERNDAIVAHYDAIALGNANLTYQLRTIVQSEQAPFPDAVYRYWIQNGTDVSGFIISENTNGTSLGAGTAIYSQTGDPGAPPAIVGIGHRVAGQDVINRLVAVAL